MTTLPEIDILFRIKSTHRPGFLAGLLKSIGEQEGLLGDITTLFVGKTHSIREVTISVRDDKHRERVESIIKNYSGAELIFSKDVVFEKHFGGKVRSVRSKEIKTFHDMRYFYTPGVARVCQAIQKNPKDAAKYTNISNSVAVVTNGTRVLGLGDIGPLASMPVMEGKAMIYDQFVGISATPILVNSKDLKTFISTVENIAQTFGGIHLEDIRVPDCFEIEDELQKRLQIPVMHDDQHGTATVALAAIMSALRSSGKKVSKSLRVTQIGLGAAGFGIAKLLLEYGMDVTGVDRNEEAQKRLKEIGGSIDELEPAIKKAHIVVATTGVVDLIPPSMIQKGHIVLALSNPYPEIAPDDALRAGAAFAADGQSVNNALAYPGLFRAALNANARTITAKMKIAAAQAISSLTDDQELLPSIFHPEVHKKVVEAVEKAAHSR